MKEITYIGPLQAAVVASVVAMILSLVGVLVGTVIPSLLSGNFFRLSSVLMVLGWPLVTGAIIFFTTVLSCVAYNWVAARFGGVKVMLS